jgi:hypothetical protein
MNILQYTRLCIATLGVVIASTVAAAQTVGNSPRIDISGVVPIAVDYSWTHAEFRSYYDSIAVVDADLAPPGSSERVEIAVLRPAWIAVEPSTLDAREGAWSRQVALKYSRVVDGAGEYELVLVARDAAGNTNTVSTTVWLVDSVNWAIPAWVELTTASGDRHIQRLMFGQAMVAHERVASIGRPVVDTSLGEIELPPLDTSRAFDARWTIDSSNGVVRSIEPQYSTVSWHPVSNHCRLYGFKPTPGTRSDTLRIRLSRFDVRLAYMANIVLTDAHGQTRFSFTEQSGRFNRLPADRRTYVQLDSAWITVVTADTSFRDGFVISLPPPSDYVSSEADPGSSMSVTPTPFAIHTRFTLETRAPSRARASVCDASGTVVRLLDDGDRIATRHTFEWDGRDEAGQALPSGVYFARAVAGDAVVSARAVLVR